MSIHEQALAMNRPLTLRDVCERFQMTRKTLMKMVNAKQFPKPKKVGKVKLFWSELPIETFLMENH
jgi:predicted DNA-binding transcriptional regulator AlpA